MEPNKERKEQHDKKPTGDGGDGGRKPQQQRPVVEEDVPKFQSTALDVNPGLNPHLTSSMTLSDAVGGGSGTGGDLSHVQSRLFVSREEKPATTRPQTWDVTDLMEEVDPYCPLEKTHKTIEDGTTPQEMAGRLTEVFQRMSLSATFDSQQATAHLISSDHIHFRVNLYLPDPDVCQTENAIVVEVQRRKGCCLSFHELAREVLFAAEKGIPPEEPLSDEAAAIDAISMPVHRRMSRTIPATSTLPPPPGLNDGEGAFDLGGSPDDVLWEAFEDVHNLLSQTKIDSFVLALELLVTVTQPDQTSHSVSLMASRLLLCGTGPSPADDATKKIDVERDAMVSSVRQCILSLIKNKALPAETHGEEWKCAPYMDVLQNLALSTLANALCVLAREGSSLGDILEIHTYLPTDLIPTLIGVLDYPTTSSSPAAATTTAGGTAKKEEEGELLYPHNAYLSAKCLHAVALKGGDRGKQVMEKNDLLLVSQQVRNLVRHANLERECDGLYETLKA